MNIDDFPFCCGIYVIGSLFEHSSDRILAITRCDEEQGGFFYNAKDAQAIKDDGDGEYELPQSGTIDELQDRALMATTISHQIRGIKYLKKNGFKPIYKFLNPNSGYIVTVWMRSPKDGSGKKV